MDKVAIKHKHQWPWAITIASPLRPRWYTAKNLVNRISDEQIYCLPKQVMVTQNGVHCNYRAVVAWGPSWQHIYTRIIGTFSLFASGTTRGPNVIPSPKNTPTGNPNDSFAMNLTWLGVPWLVSGRRDCLIRLSSDSSSESNPTCPTFLLSLWWPPCGWWPVRLLTPTSLCEDSLEVPNTLRMVQFNKTWILMRSYEPINKQ